jgi:hypothetical protein
MIINIAASEALIFENTSHDNPRKDLVENLAPPLDNNSERYFFFISGRLFTYLGGWSNGAYSINLFRSDLSLTASARLNPSYECTHTDTERERERERRTQAQADT